MDLETLRQYKTVVFNSTVGRGAQALNAIEFANLQQYIREGGGFIAIHGATDSIRMSRGTWTWSAGAPRTTAATPAAS